MGECSGENCRLSVATTEVGVEMPINGKPGKNDETVFPHPSHRPWKTIQPISTFPRHDDYDEDEYLLKPAALRNTHSKGKVTARENFARSEQDLFPLSRSIDPI
jgi:hypothetical protein